MSRHARDLASAERVLVCLRWGIGDLVMELPLLKALRRRMPQARITALGASPAIEVLEHEDCVDRIVEAQRFGFSHWGDAGDERRRARMSRWARLLRFQYVLDGSHAPRGARIALGALGLPWLDTGEYLVNRCGGGHGLSLLAEAGRVVWGVEVADERPRLSLHSDEQSAAGRTMRALVGDAPVLAVAAMASSPLKRSSLTEFARLADLLAAERGCRILVFAGRGGDGGDVFDALANKTQACVVGPLHLRLTAALLARCRVLVCNDTGLMHLAAAVGRPVVGVFACTSPALYLPPGGTCVARWKDPCRYLEAEKGRFGVTPCVDAGMCLDPGHVRMERWADAAAAAASAAFADRYPCRFSPSGSLLRSPS